MPNFNLNLNLNFNLKACQALKRPSDSSLPLPQPTKVYIHRKFETKLKTAEIYRICPSSNILAKPENHIENKRAKDNITYLPNRRKPGSPSQQTRFSGSGRSAGRSSVKLTACCNGRSIPAKRQDGTALLPTEASSWEAWEQARCRASCSPPSSFSRSGCNYHHRQLEQGPMNMAQAIVQKEGIRGLFRGLPITVLRDAPSQGVYFLAYEQVPELMHPGCRANGGESVGTMLVAGGRGELGFMLRGGCGEDETPRAAAVAAETRGDRGLLSEERARGGAWVAVGLWRGLGFGTDAVRAFVVNGAVFVAYEPSLRFCSGGGDHSHS
ncbi:hypothetical protein ACLOJK_015962 [Asimina triloba]